VDKILASFRQAQRIYKRKTPPRQQAADLNPVHGKLSSRKQFLELHFEKYTFLVADKSRGNFVMVCNNLMRLRCVQALLKAEDYQRVHKESEHIVAKIFQDMVGMLNMKHVEMLKKKWSYFYILPKLHKQSIGWRPVTACVNSVLEIPHQILAQCLRQVVNTLKDFHSKEFANSQGRIRKWWTIKNSLECVTNLSEEEIEDLLSSDIDSMFSKMDQDTVCQAVREEILFAAQIVNANAFFVVLYDTQLGNLADEGCWFNSFSGLDPSTGQQPSLKRTDKGVAYSLKRICLLIQYVVKNAYVTLGSSVQHQVKGIPQGAHASSFLANLTCYHFEKRFVIKYPWHNIQRFFFVDIAMTSRLKMRLISKQCTRISTLLLAVSL
jgi:hypothetical protein